jgi:hypothetical protein
MAVAVVPYETTYVFINFFRIFDFPYVLHFSFGVSCYAHVLV